MKEFLKTLNEKNIFVRELESSDIPYHSQYLITSAKKMTDELKKVITNPKKRSEKWISTAILEQNPTVEELKYASAEYFVHNLIESRILSQQTHRFTKRCDNSRDRTALSIL